MGLHSNSSDTRRTLPDVFILVLSRVMWSRRLLAALVVVFAGLAPAARAQVKAALVAADASVQPGRTFTVAIRLEHEPHWHTYWINPGTGYPTSIEWQLPEGWTAGDIQWPTPKVVKDRHGTITGNGYEDVVLLPVQITPPANARAGETVTLRASVDWLMCADVCIPGDAKVELSLPVRAEVPAPHPEHGKMVTAAMAALPSPVPALSVQATRAGKVITLRVSGWDAALSQPWFFSEDALVQYDAPQTVDENRAGLLVLKLPASEAYDGPAQRLVGVLRQEGSWVAGKTAPGARIDVPLGTVGGTEAAGGGNDGVSAPLFGTLALAFVGGLILNLMPCVFPVLGIKILGFVNQAGADRRKIVLHGVVFTVGVLASFWSLAALLAVLRAGGEQLGWGFQLQSPAFVFALAVVLLVFGLSMSGVFEFGLAATGVGANLQMQHGYAGSFFTGVLATVVATPCSAPFLAPALGAALALPTGESFLVFTIIALGLSVPYLLLSIFPSAVRALPRPGAWMETFKEVMAFPLYATVGYLVWVLAGQTSENGLLMALFGLTLVAMAAWLYGRYTAPGAKPARRRFGIAGGLILLGVGAWLGWPRATAPSDIVWTPWSTEAVAAARAENRPVYVDFTARWCATCQTNKRIVFSSDEVKRVFRERNIATLKADWTNRDPAITAELRKWNRSAVPFNLLYLPGDDEPIVLPELLTPGVVLEALNGGQQTARR
jgi:thiol:disulfide interchange protein/DsbC/DsbD-like thiol-disulfide interchange protein